MKRTLIYLMTLLALSFLISGCEIVLVPKPVVELPKAPSPIEVAVAAYETVDYSERFIGRVAADQNAVVYPRTTGKITAVYVSQGSNVWRNQALIKLDDSYVQDSIRQAESALSIAQANYDQTIERQESMIIQTEAQLMMAQDAYTTALSNLRDMEELQKTQDVPEMLVTQVKSAFVQAQGNLIIITDQAEKAKSETGLKIIEEQIKQAEHAVEQATRALNDTTVYAPVAGQGVQVNARGGDMAAPQMP
jgi:HlyD family secretion protein